MNHKEKKSIQQVYDAIAQHFDATRYRPWPETMKFAEKLVAEKGAANKPETDIRVLDIGCGNGRNSRYLASRGMRVIGIDLSPAQIDIARHRANEELPDADIEFFVGDATRLPFRDDRFDAVLYIATLHHLASRGQRAESLAEVHRVLGPGGLALVSVWAREQDKFAGHLNDARCQLEGDWEEGDMLLPWNRPDGEVFQRYYHLFSEDEFGDLLDSTDFEVLAVYNSADNWYGVLKK